MKLKPKLVLKYGADSRIEHHCVHSDDRMKE